MGLRARLLAVVALISLPLLALVVYVGASSRARATEEARSRVELLAQTVVNEEAGVVERARHLMMALAEAPAVRRRQDEHCGALLARLLDEYKVYTTLGVTSPSGEILCSAPAPVQGATLADRPIFQRIKTAPSFTVGEYAIGRLSGRPSLGLGYPLMNEKGTFEGMIFAALDVAWLPRLLQDIQLPAGTTLTLIERNGVVFARLPDAEGWLGKNVRESTIVRTLGTDARRTATLADLDGRDRLFTIMRLKSAPLAIVAVGTDRSLILGTIYREVGGIVAVLFAMGAIALGVVWFGTNALLVRPLRRVIEATRRFGSGELGTRIGDASGAGEIAELARTFDQMAETVAHRTRQVELAEQRYRGLFDRNLAGIFRARGGSLIDCNLAYARIFGFDSPASAMKAPLAERYVDPADRASLLEDLEGGASITREFRGRRNDGSEIWVLVQVMEVEQERTTYREGMVIDITDRRRQEALMREALALQEVAALAAAAAHEINNPLAIVQGHIELASADIRDRRRVAQISGAVQRISDIVARMSRITRLKKLSLPPNLPPTLDIRQSGETKDPAQR